MLGDRGNLEVARAAADDQACLCEICNLGSGSSGAPSRPCSLPSPTLIISDAPVALVSWYEEEDRSSYDSYLTLPSVDLSVRFSKAEQEFIEVTSFPTDYMYNLLFWPAGSVLA